MENNGYLSPIYAQSFTEFGEPHKLENSNGWIVKRRVPNTSFIDGMGCYPIFSCENWSNLSKDIDQLGEDLVCLSLVTDPFGQYTRQDLEKLFDAVTIPYKEHFVIDLSQNLENFVSSHHQRNVRRALSSVIVKIDSKPLEYLDDWIRLYGNLIQRHKITGIRKFSRKSFFQQCQVPGSFSVRAVVDHETVGMLLWYVQGNVGYYHLGAHSAKGYSLNASFALFWSSLKYFKDIGLRWLSLGAGAGSHGDQKDGLTRFKNGWSTGTRPVYFCGKILNPTIYRTLAAEYSEGKVNYFPVYRAGEFT